MLNDSDKGRESNRLVYLGLLGVAITGVMQMLDKLDLDKPLPLFLAIGAFSFAATVPLLAGLLLVDAVRPARAGSSTAFRRDVVGFIVGLVALVGVTACFLHLGLIIGIVFAASIVFSLILIPRL